MPNFQIRKRDSSGTWVPAFGLKPRSFPKCSSSTDAIAHFRDDCRKCRTHLLLLAYPDFGTRPYILDQLNADLDYEEIAKEVCAGYHKNLATHITSTSLLNLSPDASESNEGLINAVQEHLSSIFPEDVEKHLSPIGKEKQRSNEQVYYSVHHHPVVQEVATPLLPQNGDDIVIQCLDGSTVKAIWKDDIATSIQDTAFEVNNYKIQWNDYWAEYQVSKPETCTESFDSFKQALVYANNA